MRDVDPLNLVETIRESILVLEPDLTIRFANRSFCHTFAVAPEDIVGRKLYEIGGGQWNIPELRNSLETIISGRKTIEAFEVEYFFPSIGRRIMMLNAREVYRPDDKIQQILLAIDDVTERARVEREHAAAHERIGMLLKGGTKRAARAKRRSRGSRIASQPSGSSIRSLARPTPSRLSTRRLIWMSYVATWSHRQIRKATPPSCSRPTSRASSSRMPSNMLFRARQRARSWLR